MPVTLVSNLTPWLDWRGNNRADEKKRRRILEDAELTGAERGLSTIADIELGEDVGDVVLDGAFGKVEPIGDFLVRRAAAEQGHDFALAGRQGQDESFGLRA